MPNRIIKESITTSDTLAQVSAEAERLFWRLVVLADDYGLYDGRPMTILGKGFTAFLGSFKPKDVAGWLEELDRAGLIHRYVVDGKPYLQLSTWDRHQQTRAKNSKYPQPLASASIPEHSLATDSECNQMPADASTFSGNGNENVSENEERSAKAQPSPDSIVDVFGHYRSKIQPNARLIDAARQKIRLRLKDGYSPTQLMLAVDNFARDSWRMEHNSHEGAAWFFHSQDRVEKFLNLVPRASPSGRGSSQVYDPPRSEVPEWTLPPSAKTTTSP